MAILSNINNLLRISNSTGRVLINSTNAIVSNSEVLTVGGRSSLKNDSSSVAALVIVNGDSTANTFQPYMYFSDVGGNRAGFGVETSTASLKINAQANMIFSTGVASLGGTPRITILSTGKVGIGTTSPEYKVHQQGTGLQRNLIECTNNNAGGAGVFFRVMNGASQVSNGTVTIDNGGNMKFFTGTSSEAERMRIKSGGEVGISNTNPLFELCIGATPSPNRNGLEFAIANSDAGTNILQSYNRATAAYTPYRIAANTFSVLSGSNAQYTTTFAATGNVGIGATAPRDKLTVFTTGSSEEEIGLRLVNPIGFTNAGSGASIMFAQDRSQTENLPMAKIRSSQTAGGTSCCGDLIFSTMHTGVGGMVDKMIITSTGGIAFGSTRNNYGTSGEVLISNGSVSPSWGTATSVSEDNYWKIDDGLNFHLAFKEGSGTTVADIGGGRNDFTGTATWTQTGKFGYALDFNGTNQYLGGGTSPSSNVTTFSAWINNDGGGGIQNIVSGSYIMAYVSVYSNDFMIYDGTAWRNAGAVPLNEWVHVAFSYDASGNAGGLQKMYINGVLGYSATAVGYTGVASSITHVGMYAGAIRYFNGEITNIQTWDRILGDSEIQSLYNKYSGYGGSVSEASLWTLKPLTNQLLINGNISVNDFTFSYSYPATHALYISGGVTTTPVSSGVSYSAHFTIKVDNNDVALVDQHETPPEWWRQSWAFMTPSYSPGSHLVTFNALNQNGNFNMIGGAIYSQIVYRIIPL